MAKSFKDIRTKVKELVDSQKNLKEAQAAYERMSRMQYTLPSPLDQFDWVRPIISTAPYDALRGVKRALANLEESLSIDPITVVKVVGDGRDSEVAKVEANDWETILLWQMQMASKRRAAMRSSVVESAALYDEVVGQLIHLPTQFKATGHDTIREKAALRFGDWALRLVNPQTVYVEYSDYMPERVVNIQMKKAQEIVDFWGDAASGIAAKIRKDQEYAGEWLLEIDYVDYDQRVVWVIEKDADIEDKGVTVLPSAPWLTDTAGNPVPFLPWIAVAGGSDIDIAPEHQRKPLLYPVYQAELWGAQNITNTLMHSEVIAEFAGPKYALTGPGVEDKDIDHGQPGGRIDLNQFQKFEILRQEGMSQGITEAYDRIDSAIRRTTIADILVTGQPMGGVEAFAAYNLQVQVAIASLGGVKNLGERFYEELYTTMLLMTHYTGEEIIGYEDEQWKIDSEDIDPESIYLSVELNVDVPVDRVQRITAAATLAQNADYPMERIIEFLGDTDPQGAMKLYYKEQIRKAYLTGVLQKVQAEGSGELEQMAQMLEQAMQALEQVQQAPQGPTGNGRTPPMPGGGLEGVEGQGMNPAAGGLPPATVAPGATRETQTGGAFGV
jgi:hypothetical protein